MKRTLPGWHIGDAGHSIELPEADHVFCGQHGCVGFLSHCGSRGFGHALASGQFRALQQKFDTQA